MYIYICVCVFFYVCNIVYIYIKINMCKREIYIHITDYSFTPLVFFQVAIETMMYKVRLSRPYELKKI